MFILTTDFQDLTDANILNAKTQSREVFNFYEHEMHERNGTSVPSVSSVFMFILTTDIQDFRDINHERKRDNPFNLCYLWSRKDKESTAARAVSPTYNEGSP